MPQYNVTKSINTTFHRLRAGDPVDRTYDLAPFTFDALKDEGVIVEKAATPVPDKSIPLDSRVAQVEDIANVFTPPADTPPTFPAAPRPAPARAGS